MASVILKKLTFLQVAGTPSQPELMDILRAGGTEIPHKMQVLGLATGKKEVVDVRNGNKYYPFIGQFRAFGTNYPDGADSALLYLPDIAGNLIEAQLMNGQAVEFVIEVGMRFPRKGEVTPTGYIFTATIPDQMIQPNNPLDRLAALVGYMPSRVIENKPDPELPDSPE